MGGREDDGEGKGGAGRAASPVASGPQSPGRGAAGGGDGPEPPALWGGVPAQPRSRVTRSQQAAARATSGYAWRVSGPQAGGAPDPARGDSMLWIDFIRLQPAVPVGAMAAAKKAERCV